MKSSACVLSLASSLCYGEWACRSRAKANAAYKHFLTFRKGAYPDIPIYQQAKAEFAKLK